MKYVLMIKEGDRIYGRVPEEAGTSGFIVFFHKDMKEAKEGLYKIHSLDIKENEERKFGFIKGELVEPQDFDVDKLTPEQLYYLSSVGFIYDLYKYNGKPVICIKNPNHLDNIYKLAFLVDGKFVFINKLKYHDNKLEYVKDIYDYEKQLFKLGLSTKFRAFSHPVENNVRPLTESMKQNMDKLIWRRIYRTSKGEEYAIALYRTSLLPFNEQLYNDILEYNNQVNEIIRCNSNEFIKDEQIRNKVLKLLSFYGLNK